MDEEIKQTRETLSTSAEPALSEPDSTEQPATHPAPAVSEEQPTANSIPDGSVPSQQPTVDPLSLGQPTVPAPAGQPAAEHSSVASAEPSSPIQTGSTPVAPTPADWDHTPMRSAFPLDTTAHRSGSSEQNTAQFYMNSASTENYDSNASEEFSNGYGIASLVLGILSLFGGCCCCIPGFLFSILGIVFGCVQPKDQMDQKPGIAIAGIILSSIGLIISLCAALSLAVTTVIQQ